MSPFTLSDSKCISSLAMTTLPSWYFSWGDIYSLVSPSLVASTLASSTTFFGRSSLCPTICLLHTPTYHAACTVHHSKTLSQNEPQPILVQSHQYPYPTKNDHKLPVSNPWIPSFPFTSSVPAPTRFLRRLHYVGTSSSPATFVNGRTLQDLRLTLPLYLQPKYLPIRTTEIFHCVTQSFWSLARMITLQG